MTSRAYEHHYQAALAQLMRDGVPYDQARFKAHGMADRRVSATRQQKANVHATTAAGAA